jgi:Spy/CpxP family protein refolding chaperone
MKKIYIKEVICTIIISLVLAPGLAFAYYQGEKYGETPGQGPRQGLETGRLCNIAEELGLSAEQEEQLKEQKFQESYTRIDTQNKIRLKELQLRHELEKAEIDREGLNNIVQELKELQGTMVEQRVDSILKMKQILTPEQFEKLHSLHIQRIQGRARQKGSKGFLQGLKEKFRGLRGQ